MRQAASRWRVVRLAMVCLALGSGMGTAGAALEASFELEEAYAEKLIEAQYFDYAEDQVRYLRTAFAGKELAIKIVEGRLLISQGKRADGMKKLDEVPKTAPEYPKVLGLKLDFITDPEQRAQAFKLYFAAVPPPKADDKDAVERHRAQLFRYVDLLQEQGKTQDARNALKMLEGMPGGDQPGAKEHVALKSAQILLRAADDLKAAKKPLAEYKTMVEQAQKELTTLTFKMDFFSVSAYPEIMHAQLLLGKTDEAVRTFDTSFELLKQIEGEMKKNGITLSASPVAPGLFYLAEVFLAQAQVMRAKEKAEKNPDQQRELKRATRDQMLKAAKLFRTVNKRYPDAPITRESLTRYDFLSRVLKDVYDYEDQESSKSDEQEMKYKLGNEYFNNEQYDKAAQAYLQAIGANLHGENVKEAAYFCCMSFCRLRNFWSAMAMDDFLIERFRDSDQAAQATYNLGVVLYREATELEKTSPAEAERFKRLSTDYFTLFVAIAPTDPNAAKTAYRIAETQYDKAAKLREEIEKLEKEKAPQEKINEKILAAKGEYAQAIPLYESVVRNHGASEMALKAYQKLGWIYQILERREEAAKAFLAYADADGDWATPAGRIEARYLSADNYLRGEDADGALEQFTNLIKQTDKGGPWEKLPTAARFREQALAFVPWAYCLKVQQLQTKIDDAKAMLVELQEKAKSGAAPAAPEQTAPEKAPAKEAPKAAPATTEAKGETTDGNESDEAAAASALVKPTDTSLTVEDVTKRIEDLTRELAKYRQMAIDGLTERITGHASEAETPNNMAKLGSLYGQMGDFTNAAKWLEQLDQKYPNTPAGQQAMFTLFRSYLTINATDKAKQVAQRMSGRLKEYALPSVVYIATKLFETDAKQNETVLDSELALAANQEIVRRAADKRHADNKDAQALRQRSLYLVAKCNYLMKKYDDTIAIVDPFLKEFPRGQYKHSASILLAMSQKGKGQAEEAVNTLNALLGPLDTKAFPAIRYQALVEMARIQNESTNREWVGTAATSMISLIDYPSDAPDALPWLEAAYAELVRSLALLGQTKEAESYRDKYLGQYVKGLYRKEVLMMPPAKF